MNTAEVSNVFDLANVTLGSKLAEGIKELIENLRDNNLWKNYRICKK
jgi:hypothetical protein